MLYLSDQICCASTVLTVKRHPFEMYHAQSWPYLGLKRLDWLESCHYQLDSWPDTNRCTLTLTWPVFEFHEKLRRLYLRTTSELCKRRVTKQKCLQSARSKADLCWSCHKRKRFGHWLFHRRLIHFCELLQVRFIGHDRPSFVCGS